MLTGSESSGCGSRGQAGASSPPGNADRSHPVGVLRYTVRRGSVIVRRGESDQHPEVVRTIRAGQTGSIRPGEWIVEQPSDIHQAANNGSTPVVIYLATLLETGAPPSTPVSLSRPR